MAQTTIYSNLGLFDKKDHASFLDYEEINNLDRVPPKQLLKWIGNKQ